MNDADLILKVLAILFSILAMLVSFITAFSIHRENKALKEKELTVTLLKDVESKLVRIPPDLPDGNQVREAFNALIKVTAIRQSSVVNDYLLRAIYRDAFVIVYDSLAAHNATVTINARR